MTHGIAIRGLTHDAGKTAKYLHRRGATEEQHNNSDAELPEINAWREENEMKDSLTNCMNSFSSSHPG